MTGKGREGHRRDTGRVGKGKRTVCSKKRQRRGTGMTGVGKRAIW